MSHPNCYTISHIYLSQLIQSGKWRNLHFRDPKYSPVSYIYTRVKLLPNFGHRNCTAQIAHCAMQTGLKIKDDNIRSDRVRHPSADTSEFTQNCVQTGCNTKRDATLSPKSCLFLFGPHSKTGNQCRFQVLLSPHSCQPDYH